MKKAKRSSVGKIAVLGSTLFAFLCIAGGGGVYYYLSTHQVVPEGERPLAPLASEAPKANYSGPIADNRGDATAQLAMPEDLKMPTSIDIQSPQVPGGLADPASQK